MKVGTKKKGVIVGIELLIALTFIIGAEWASKDLHLFFHNYYADIVLPFGFYFLLFLVEDRLSFFRPWHNKALVIFLLVLFSEVLQYFGVYALARTFDMFDIFMYSIGIILAMSIDVTVISERKIFNNNQ